MEEDPSWIEDDTFSCMLSVIFMVRIVLTSNRKMAQRLHQRFYPLSFTIAQLLFLRIQVLSQVPLDLLQYLLQSMPPLLLLVHQLYLQLDPLRTVLVPQVFQPCIGRHF